MKHNILSFLSLALVLSFCSCEKDESRGLQTSSPLRLSVSVSPFVSMTKAQPVNSVADMVNLCQPMRLYFTDYTETPAGAFLCETNVRYDSANNYWKPESDYMWESGSKLDCCAIAPYDSFMGEHPQNTVTTSVNLADNNASVSIHLGTNVLEGTELAEYPDIMVGYYCGTGDASGIVNLLFRHLFAGVTLVPDPSQASHLSVSKVEFRNIKRVADVTYISTIDTNWDMSRSSEMNLTRTYDGDFFSDSDKTFMMIPQSLGSDALLVITASIDGAPEKEYATTLFGQSWCQDLMTKYRISIANDALFIEPDSVSDWTDTDGGLKPCANFTTLVPGEEFGKAISTLAGGSGQVKSVRFIHDATITEGTEVQNFDSAEKVYANFDSSTGEVTVSSASEEIFLNPDASMMFGNLQALESVDFGILNATRVTNMAYFFFNCQALSSVDYSSLVIPSITTTTGMFSWCYALGSVQFGENFNTSNVTSMCGMFAVCPSLQALDLSGFDTSKVKNMKWMFESCCSLTEIVGVSAFDTSSCLYMTCMFESCNSLTTLDLSGWDTSKVTDMTTMFRSCNNLSSLDVSNFNTSNVTNMSEMFHSCNNLSSLDLSNFNTSSVTNMSEMFEGCNSLTTLELSSFNTSNVTNMSEMFSNCDNLSSLDISNFNTSNVTSMVNMFLSCNNLSSLDLSNFDTSNVTDMADMFSFCANLSSLDISNFNTSNVTNMSAMFSYCANLGSINLSNFNTSNVTNMGRMFDGCNSLTTLDLSSFDTSNVTNMDCMLLCWSLTSLQLGTSFVMSDSCEVYNILPSLTEHECSVSVLSATWNKICQTNSDIAANTNYIVTFLE